MFLSISLKQLKPKWRLLIKALVFFVILCYVIPKFVFAISGMSNPPGNPKLRDDKMKEGPMKVELGVRLSTLNRIACFVQDK